MSELSRSAVLVDGDTYVIVDPVAERRALRDAEYRRALGVRDDEDLPARIGVVDHSHGKGRNGGYTPGGFSLIAARRVA